MKKNSLWVAVVLVVILLLSGCNKGPYELSQSPENIVTIQLCRSKGELGAHTYPEQVKVIRQLEEDEFDAFVQDICQLELHLTTPPARGYGTNIVVITYSDGSMDIISNRALEYVMVGDRIGQTSTRCFTREEFDAVFSKYAEKE